MPFPPIPLRRPANNIGTPTGNPLGTPVGSGPGAPVGNSTGLPVGNPMGAPIGSSFSSIQPVAASNTAVPAIQAENPMAPQIHYATPPGYRAPTIPQQAKLITPGPPAPVEAAAAGAAPPTEVGEDGLPLNQGTPFGVLPARRLSPIGPTMSGPAPLNGLLNAGRPY